MYMSDWECMPLKLFGVGLHDWGLLENKMKIDEKHSSSFRPE